jgi:type II secretory pathway component PulK
MRRRGGFVLVAALWLIVALSAVALDAALRSQPVRRAAANGLDDTRVREAALAGSEYARARLSAAMLERAEELRAQVAQQAAAQQGAGARTFAGGQQQRGQPQQRGRLSMAALIAADDPWRDPHELMAQGMTVGAAAFSLDVHDLGASLNLNTATEDMLRAFLSEGLRLDYAKADHLTQAILDWRDEDELPRINGGEREQYIDAGLAVLPANRAFASVDELRHVMGMTPELFERVQPYLTVVGSGRININAAPEPVLYAVPTFNAAVVAALLRIRDGAERPRNVSELRAMLGRSYRAPTGAAASEFTRRVGYSTNEVEVVSTGSMAGSAMQGTVRAIIGRSDAGALVLWRRVQ